MAANWLDELFAAATNTTLKIYTALGVLMQPRVAMQFKGAGQSLSDNAGTGRTEVNIPGPDAMTFDLPLRKSAGTTPTISIDAATTSARGTISAADQLKINGIGATANVCAVTQGAGILVTTTAGSGGTALTREVAADLDYVCVGGEVGAHNGFMTPAMLGDLENCVEALTFPSASLVLPLVVNENRIITLPGASGDVLIPVAASGHSEDIVVIIRCPAGNATSITFADDLHVQGDAFDPSEDYEVRIQFSGGQFIARAVSSPALDTHTPLVLSATVFEADPDALVVLCDRDMYGFALTGLSLNFSVGTARTITGLTGGNGTNTLTYGLSGDISGSDVFSFVIAGSNGLISMNGQAKGAQTIGVTNSVIPALTGLIADWDWNVTASTTESGGAQSAQADESGHGNTIAQATGGKQPAYDSSDSTLNNLPTVHFEKSTGHILAKSGMQQSGGAVADKDHYSIAMIVKRPATAQQIYCEFTPSALFGGLLIMSSGSTDCTWAVASPTTADHSVYASYATTAWHSLIVTYAKSGMKRILIDGVEVKNDTDATNPAALVNFALGWSVGELAGYPCDADFNRVTIFDHCIAPRMAGAPSDVDFDGTAHTITRNTGSFLDDGFAIGQIPTIAGTTSNNGVASPITNVTATVLTLAGGLTTEANVNAPTITATSANFTTWENEAQARIP
jgi:hypothetical protein